MKTVQITLDLSPSDIIRVMKLLENSPANNTVTTQEVTMKPAIKSKITMPSFGRNQKQIDAFTEIEQERFDKKTEEELVKDQRAEERKVKQAEKQQVVDDKKETAKIQEAEILEIKTAATENLGKVEMPKSPFTL